MPFGAPILEKELEAANAFNRAARPGNIPSYFEERMTRKFGVDTARLVVEKLEELQIPEPRSRAEFISATSGALIFSNNHGVVLRIEEEDGAGFNQASRANDSIWMLQPLGAVKAGKAHIEICPGVHYENRDVESRKLYWRMMGEGYHYWDERIDNAGRLPFKTPEFPEGVTVSVDRMAAVTLTNAVNPIRRALGIAFEGLTGGFVPMAVRSPVEDPRTPLAEVLAELKTMSDEVMRKVKGRQPAYTAGVDDPQEILYGDLRRSFKEAWPEGAEKPSPTLMRQFWQKVEQAREDGKLVAGWNELENDDGTKTYEARTCADAYESSPHKIGAIHTDLQLQQALGAIYDALFPLGNISICGNPGGRYNVSTLSTSDGYQNLTLVMPDRDFTPAAYAVENIYGLDGIGHNYNYPYGMAARDVNNFAQGLLHMELRGMVTPEQREEGLTYMWRNLQRHNPALAGVLPENPDVDRLHQAVTGFAAAYPPQDLKFMLEPANESYIDSPRYAALHRPLRDIGLSLEWAAAPETLLSLNQRLETRQAKLGVEPRQKPATPSR